MKTFYKLSTVFLLAICAQTVFSQEPTQKDGIELYKKGDFQGAVSILSKSDKVEDLYYLGLSYEKTDQKSKAKDTYKAAFAKSYEIFFEIFDGWRKIEYSESKKPLMDFLKESKANNELGYASAQKAYSLKSDIFQTNEWRIKAKILLDAVNLSETEEKIYSSVDKTIEKFKITEKPRAKFPKHLDGSPIAPADMSPNKGKTITVFVIFGADGEVKFLIPTEKKMNVLTGSVIEAIGKIKFEPATKDKKTVTAYAQLQYSFSIG